MNKRNRNLLKEKKRNIKLTSEFVFWKGKKIIGASISIVSIIFLIFSFVPVPVLTTIHAYTVGALFGFFSPLFYFLTFSYGVIFLLEGKISTWIKIRYLFVWYFLFSVVIFLVGSSSYYLVNIEKNAFLKFGAEIWTKSYNNWWITFSNNSGAFNPVTPDTLTPGIIGFLFFDIFASAGTIILSFVVASVIFSMGIFYLIFGSPIVKIQERSKAIQIKKLDLFNYETNVLDLTREDVLTGTFEIKPHLVETINETKELNTKKESTSLNVVRQTMNLDAEEKTNFTNNLNKTKEEKTANFNNLENFQEKNVSTKSTNLNSLENTKEEKTVENNDNQKINSLEMSQEENILESNTFTSEEVEKPLESTELVFFGNNLEEVEEINEKFLPKKTKWWKRKEKTEEMEKTKDFTKSFPNEDVDLNKIEEIFSSNEKKQDEILTGKTSVVIEENKEDITSEMIFPFDDPFSEE